MQTRKLIFKSSTLALIGVALTGCASDEQSEQQPQMLPCGPLNSGFDGDERCILPPAPEEGIQLHVGPKDYTDQAEIEKFILLPGEEITECYYFTNPADHPINFFRQVYRMRPGSHHLIIHTSLTGGTGPAEGWGDCYGPSDAAFMPIGGTQNGVSEFPPNGEIAPEDKLLIRPLPAGAPMKFELHFVNTTSKPILREAWVNLLNNDTDTKQILGGIFMVGGTGMSVAPGTSQVLNYWCDNDQQDRRVVSLFGHRHAHTTRFSVWKNRGTALEELIYEDYDWEETQELVYNSMIENPTPNRSTETAGGYGGMLTFNPGDRIEFECEIDNTEANSVAPSPEPLRFANEVYTAEMCNLFGSMVTNNPDPNASGLGGFFWGNRTPVTSSGTLAPVATVGGTPLGPWELVIDALESGETTITARFSTDGGNIWSDPITVTDDGVPVELIDPAIDSRVGANGKTGITVAFAAGTFNADNRWTAKTLCSSRR